MGTWDAALQKTRESLIEGAFRDDLAGEEIDVADFGPELAPPNRLGLQVPYRASFLRGLVGEHHLMAGLVLTPTRLLLRNVRMVGFGGTGNFCPDPKHPHLTEMNRDKLDVAVVRPAGDDGLLARDTLNVEFHAGGQYRAVACQLSNDYWRAILDRPG